MAGNDLAPGAPGRRGIQLTTVRFSTIMAILQAIVLRIIWKSRPETI